MMRKVKTILSVVLLIAMVLTTPGFCTFASSIQRVNLINSLMKGKEDVTYHRYYEEYKAETKQLLLNDGNDNASLFDDSEDDLSMNNSSDIIRKKKKELELDEETDVIVDKDSSERDNEKYDVEAETDETEAEQNADDVDSSQKSINENNIQNVDKTTNSQISEETISNTVVVSSNSDTGISKLEVLNSIASANEITIDVDENGDANVKIGESVDVTVATVSASGDKLVTNNGTGEKTYVRSEKIKKLQELIKLSKEFLKSESSDNATLINSIVDLYDDTKDLLVELQEKQFVTKEAVSVSTEEFKNVLLEIQDMKNAGYTFDIPEDDFDSIERAITENTEVYYYSIDEGLVSLKREDELTPSDELGNPSEVDEHNEKAMSIIDDTPLFGAIGSHGEEAGSGYLTTKKEQEIDLSKYEGNYVFGAGANLVIDYSQTDKNKYGIYYEGRDGSRQHMLDYGAGDKLEYTDAIKLFSYVKYKEVTKKKGVTEWGWEILGIILLVAAVALTVVTAGTSSPVGFALGGLGVVILTGGGLASVIIGSPAVGGWTEEYTVVEEERDSNGKVKDYYIMFKELRDRRPVVINDRGSKQQDDFVIVKDENIKMTITDAYRPIYGGGKIYGMTSWMSAPIGDSGLNNCFPIKAPTKYYRTTSMAQGFHIGERYYNFPIVQDGWAGKSYIDSQVALVNSFGYNLGHGVELTGSGELTCHHYLNGIPVSSFQNKLTDSSNWMKQVKKIAFIYEDELYRIEDRYAANKQAKLVFSERVPSSNGLYQVYFSNGELYFVGRDTSKKIYVYEDANHLFNLNWTIGSQDDKYSISGSAAFTNCTFDLTNLDFSKVKNLSYAFEGCGGTIIKPVWSIPENVNCEGMFKKSNFARLDLREWTFPANAKSMFESSGATKVYVGSAWDDNFNPDKATNFANGSGLVGQAGTKASDYNGKTHILAHTDRGQDDPGLLWGSFYELYPGWFDRKNIQNPKASEITKIIISKYPTAPPTDYNAVWTLPDSNGGFSDNKYLTCYLKGTEVTIYGPDRSRTRVSTNSGIESDIRFPKNISRMFSGFESLTEIEGLDMIVTEDVENTSYMFNDCKSLPNIELKEYIGLTDTSYMFNNCTALTSIDLKNLTTDKVTNMSHMFNNCSTISSIDLTDFKTTNVQDMSYMFAGLESISGLDLSSFNTSNVTNMSYMFAGTKSIRELDLSGFNTSNVTNMSYMFFGNKSTSINLSSFNTSNVTRMLHMFENAENLESINISNFDMSKIQDFSYLFAGCKSAKSIDVSKINTENVINMSHMFENCENVTTLNLSNFNTANVTDMTYMFKGCQSATSINTSSFNTGKVTSTINMFDGCTALKTVDLTSFNVTNVGRFDYMFRDCESLTTIIVDRDYRNWTNGKSAIDLFKNCKSLVGGGGFKYSNSHINGEYARLDYGGIKPGYFTCSNQNVYSTIKLYLPKDFYPAGKSKTDVKAIKINNDKTISTNENEFTWTYNDEKYYGYVSSKSEIVIHFASNIPKIYLTGNCSEMFSSYTNITELDVSKLDTSEVGNMSYMFKGLSKVKVLDVSGFDTKNVGGMTNMFESCSSLENLDLSNFDTSNVINMYRMFDGCTALKHITLSDKFKTAKVNTMEKMFSNCKNLESIDVSSFNTSAVTKMNNMFYGCEKIKELDLEGFDTTNVSSIEGMFSYCKALTTIYVSNNFKTGHEGTSVFAEDTMLKGGNGTEFSHAHIDSSYAKVDGGTENPGYFTMKYILHKGDIFKNITGTYDVIYDIVFARYPQTVDTITYNTNAPSGMSALNMPWDDKGEIADTKGLRAYVGNRYYDSNKSRRHETLVIYAPTSGTIYLDEDVSSLFVPTRNSTKVNYVYGLDKLNSSNVRDMSNMFKNVGADSDGYYSIALTDEESKTLNLSTFNTEKVTTMESMLEGSGYTYVNMLNNDTSSLTNTKKMFYNMSKLTTIYSNGFTNLSQITESKEMFSGSSNLVGGKGTVQTEDHVDKAYAIVDGGEANPGYLTSDYTTYYILNPGWYSINGTRSMNANQIKNITFDSYPNSIPSSYDETWTITNSNAGYNDGQYLTCYRNGTDLTIYAPARKDADGNDIDIEPKIYVAKTNSYLFTGDGSESGSQFSSLENIYNMDKLHFDLVTTADKTFYGCNNLKEVSIYDMNQVEEIKNMFKDSGVRSISFFNSNTSKVTDLSNMFEGLSNLKSVTFDAGFDAKNVTTMERMFYSCPELVDVDISSFDSEALTNVDSMFEGSNKLVNIKFGSKFTIKQVESIDKLFYKCASLSSIDLSSFDTSNVKYMDYTFADCQSLKSVNLSGLNTKKVEEMIGLFRNCSSLKSLDLSSFDTSALMRMQGLFTGDSALERVTFGTNFKIQNVVTLAELFKDCSSLKEVDLSSFDTSKVVGIGSMFEGCTSLTSVNIGSFNLSNVTSMDRVFYNCASLSEINLGNFNASQATDASYMFYNCKSLKNITFSAYSNVYSVKNMSYMFYGCETIEELNLSSFNTNAATNMSYMFANCKALKTINVSNFNTSSVTSMQYMFANCHNLTDLSLTNFNTSAVTNMTSMFEGDKALKSIYVSTNFTVTSVSSSDNMFYGCESIEGCEGTTYDEDNIDRLYARIDKRRTSGIPGYFSNVYVIHGGDTADTFKNLSDESSYDYIVYDVAFLRYPQTIDDLPINSNVPSNFTAVDLSWVDKGEISGTGGLKAYLGNVYRDTSKSSTYLHKTLVIYAPEEKPIIAAARLDRLFYPGGRKTVSQIYGLDLIDTSNAVSAQYMFSYVGSQYDNYSSIKTDTEDLCLDLTSFNTKSMSAMNVMFYSAGLKEIDLSSFSAESVADVESMFNNCTELTTIYASDSFNLSNKSIRDNNMFYADTKLVGGQGTIYNSSKIGKEYARVDRTVSKGEPGYFTYEDEELPIHIHKICGMATTSTCTHTGHDEGVLYDALSIDVVNVNDRINGINSYSGVSEYIYLQKDIELNSGEITLTRDVYICLNGHSIKGTFKASNYNVYITNCKKDVGTLKSDGVLFENIGTQIYSNSFGVKKSKNISIEASREVIKADSLKEFYLYNVNLVKTQSDTDLIKLNATNRSDSPNLTLDNVSFEDNVSSLDTTYYVNNNNSKVTFKDIKVKNINDGYSFVYSDGSVRFEGDNTISDNSFNGEGIILSTKSTSSFNIAGNLNVDSNTIYGSDIITLNSVILNEDAKIYIGNNKLHDKAGKQSILYITGNSANVFTGECTIENNKLINATSESSDVKAALYIPDAYLTVGSKAMYIRNNKVYSDSGNTIDNSRHMYGLLGKNNYLSGIIYILYGKTFSKNNRIDSIAFDNINGKGVVCVNWNQAESSEDFNTVFKADTFKFNDVALGQYGDGLLLADAHMHMICGEKTHTSNSHTYGIHSNVEYVYEPIPQKFSSNSPTTTLINEFYNFMNGYGTYAGNSQYMYLTDDLIMPVNSSYGLSLDRDIYICLNGHSISKALINGSRNHIYICNCKDDIATVTSAKNLSYTGTFKNASLQVYGKKIDGNNNIVLEGPGGVISNSARLVLIQNGEDGRENIYLYNTDLVTKTKNEFIRSYSRDIDIVLEGISVSKTYANADCESFIKIVDASGNGISSDITIKDIKISNVDNASSLIEGPGSTLIVDGDNEISNYKLVSSNDLIKVQNLEIKNNATFKLSKNELALRDNVEQSILNVSGGNVTLRGNLELTNNKITKNTSTNTESLSAMKVGNAISVGTGSITIKDNRVYDADGTISTDLHMYGLYSTITDKTSPIFTQISGTKFSANSRIDSIALNTSDGEGLLIQNWNEGTAVDKNLYSGIFTADRYKYSSLGVQKNAANEIIITTVAALPSEYTAYLYADGGEFTQGATTRIENIKYNDDILHFEIPRRNGYTFAGYYVSTSSKIEYLNEVWPYHADADVHASWSAINYKIRFLSNGGDGTMSDQDMTYGIEKNVKDNQFTRDGYDFDGWTVEGRTDAISDKAPINNLTTKDGDIVYFKANWKGKKFTIKHDPNGGKPNSSIVDEVWTYGEEKPYISLGTHMYQRDGYVMTGWALSTDSEMVIANGGYLDQLKKYEPEITVYAKWQLIDLKSYGTLTINANKGKINNSDEVTIYSEVGTGKITLPEITRKGYTLDGFTKDNSSGPNYIIPKKLNPGDNITVYAKWKGNNYNIVYHSNNSEYKVATIAEARDGNYKGRENTFSWIKKGYKFVGWTLESDGQGKVYEPNTSYDELSDEEVINLYAKWERKKVTITYDANDGNGNMPDETFFYAKDEVISYNAYSKDNYVFSGWALNSTDTTIKYVDGNSVDEIIADNNDKDKITLYAVWVSSTNIANVKYDPNGGLIGNSPKVKLVKVAIGSPFVKVAARRKGYNQTDYTNGSSVVIAAGTIINADVDAKAGWKEKEYKVLLDGKNGTGVVEIGPYKYYTDTFSISSTIFTKNGYVLRGFDNLSNADDVRYILDSNTISQLTEEEKIKLYAVWEGNDYTIRYNANGGSGVVNDTSFKYGDIVELALNTYTKGSDSPKGWKYTDTTGKVLYLHSGQVVDTKIFDVPSTGFVELVALYNVEKGEVFIDANGGYYDDATEGLRVVYLADGDVVPFIEPQRSGYKFKNWYIEENGVKTVVGDYWTYGSGKTAIAEWEPITYYITYESSDADDANKMQLDITAAQYGKEAVLNDNKFERPGYEFDSWSIRLPKNDARLKYKAGATVSNLELSEGASVSAKTVWKGKPIGVKKYVRYEDQLIEYKDSTYTVEYGVPADILSKGRKNTFSVRIPLIIGSRVFYIVKDVEFAIVGWTVGTKSELSSSSIIEFVPESPFVYRDRYDYDIGTVSITQMIVEPERIQGYVKVDGMGASVGGLAKCEVPVIDGEIIYPAVYRDDMTFTRWDVKGHEGMTINATNLMNTDYEIYPVFERGDKYQIKYYSNNGSGRYETVDYEYGQFDGSDEQIKTAADYGWTKRGYTFKGWSPLVKGENAKLIKPGESMLQIELDDSKELTICTKLKLLYAQWEPYTKKVHYHDGNPILTTLGHLLTYGTSQRLKEHTITKEGYTFIGWATDGEDGEIKYSDRESVEELILNESEYDIQLYPVWAKDDEVVDVVYKGNGGTIAGVKSYPIKVKIGSKFRSIIAQNGRRETTRYVDKDGNEITEDTIITDDMLVYAKWN